MVLLKDSTQTQSPTNQPNRTNLWGLLAVIGGALVVYLLTMPPGLLWGGGDFARFQTWGYTGQVDRQVDIFAHPLWVYIVHPFVAALPVGDPAWRSSFITAVFAIAALAFFFEAARYISKSLPAALLATATLGVSHTFWTYAVMPKVYSLNSLLIVLSLYLLLRWRATSNWLWLGLSTFFIGLGLLNHLLIATAGLGLVAFIFGTLWANYKPEPSVKWTARLGGLLRTRTFWLAWLVSGLSFVAGLVPYIILMLQTQTTSGTSDTIVGFIKGLFYMFVHPIELVKGIGWGLLLGVYQFPLTTIVGVFGFYLLWKRDKTLFWGLLGVIGGTTAFLFGALDPTVGGVYVWNLHYYLQAYIAFALALVPAFAALWELWPARRQIVRPALITGALLVPIVLYAVAPLLARPFLTNMPDFRPLPGRDNLVYVLSPWKQQETGAHAYGTQMLDKVPSGGVIFADYSLWAVMRYLQTVEGARPDVTLVRIDEQGMPGEVPLVLNYKTNPQLYLADTYQYYDLKGLEQYFTLVPEAPIYRLVPKS